ncbi:streptomycin 6-kinase [Pseudonocardia eucalypti]|uniref:aminoglycoside phosphotransferase family protein n=1 Tax=Pseudonocardia eucalypti TaxID=648755 RepID=UPI00161943D7|nr:streptomycin 6-kinase [Pseudonocardia eucalypti]
MTAVPFPIPRNLRESIEEDEDPEREEWLRRLPGTIAELTERWELRLDPPFEPGGTISWVAPASDRDGEARVLKVSWAGPETLHEAEGLREWDGDGTALLYRAERFDHTSAMLLEHCRPGTPLARLRAEPERDEIVAGLLRNLWRHPADGHPFRPLHVMCDQWADEFEEDYEPGDLDPGLARAGTALFRELPRSAPASVLLCTDLHAENILAGDRRPWLVIDPKPYLGDPHYDPLQHMLNCPGRLIADPIGFTDRMAGLLDLDRERLRAWLFARCVQEGIWRPELGVVAARIAPA